MHEDLYLKLISSVCNLNFFFTYLQRKFTMLWGSHSDAAEHSSLLGSYVGEVGIATRHALDVSRFEPQWVRDFPQPPRPSLVPIQWVPGLLPVVKSAEAWCCPPTATSASPPTYTPMAYYGMTFTFTFRITRHDSLGGWCSHFSESSSTKTSVCC